MNNCPVLPITGGGPSPWLTLGAVALLAAGFSLLALGRRRPTTLVVILMVLGATALITSRDAADAASCPPPSTADASPNTAATTTTAAIVTTTVEGTSTTTTTTTTTSTTPPTTTTEVSTTTTAPPDLDATATLTVPGVFAPPDIDPACVLDHIAHGDFFWLVIDDATNVVVASTPVTADGVYTVEVLAPAAYRSEISAVNTPVGSEPAAPVAPTSASYTYECPGGLTGGGNRRIGTLTDSSISFAPGQVDGWTLSTVSDGGGGV